MTSTYVKREVAYLYEPPMVNHLLLAPMRKFSFRNPTKSARSFSACLDERNCRCSVVKVGKG